MWLVDCGDVDKLPAGCNVKGVLLTLSHIGTYCVLELNPRFGGGFPFSYEAGVNLPKAIIQWLKGEIVDPKILVPQYGKMFAKNDYLMEIKEY